MYVYYTHIYSCNMHIHISISIFTCLWMNYICLAYVNYWCAVCCVVELWVDTPDQGLEDIAQNARDVKERHDIGTGNHEKEALAAPEMCSAKYSAKNNQASDGPGSLAGIAAEAELVGTPAKDKKFNINYESEAAEVSHEGNEDSSVVVCTATEMHQVSVKLLIKSFATDEWWLYLPCCLLCLLLFLDVCTFSTTQNSF